MEEIEFLAWSRSKALATARRVGGRLAGSVPFELEEAGRTLSGEAKVFFTGASDVAGLKPSAIRHLAPRPATADAETTKLVHVDFIDPDLPWRYSPASPEPAGRLMPWLALVVGTVDEMQVEGGLVTRIEDVVLEAHKLVDAHRFAHVQQDRGLRISRLLSPRRLIAQSEHFAAIVPVFDEAGELHWTGRERHFDRLPAFFSWRFRAGEEGDFETLATALRLRPAGTLGIAKLRYRRSVTGVDVPLTLGGAITSLKSHPDERDEVDEARQDLDQLNEPLADVAPPERKFVQLPAYGGLWLQNPDAAQWGKSLNDDARHRGVAGLGFWLGVVEQEALMDAAVKQAGSLQEAAQRISHLAFGLDVAARLWRQRLPQAPELQLRIFGSAMGRMLAADGGTVLARVTSETSVLDPAVFSSAAQRLLRNGSARARFAAGGRIDRRAVLAAANEPPERQEKAPAGVPHVDAVAAAFGEPPLEDALGLPPLDERLDAILSEFDGQPNQPEIVRDFVRAVDEAFGVSCIVLIERYFEKIAPHPRFLDREALLGAIESCLVPGEARGGRLQALPRPETPDGRRPIKLAELAGAVAGAIDPTQPRPPAWERIASMIEGIDLTALAPPEAPIGLDFPTWTLLNRHAREWLLPGVGAIPPDSIVSLQTNPRFIDAFMLGINTQFLGEMRWRNLPAPRISTPLRMFWGYVDHTSGEREPDIRPVSEWPSAPFGAAGADDVGDLSHQAIRPTDRTGRQDLVIAFRTALFRRYPSTLVYLVRPDSDENLDTLLKAPPDFAEEGVSPDHRRYFGPIFFGQIEPDLVFFAFDIDPQKLDEFWLVLDEPPSELRFKDKGMGEANSAEFAKFNIDLPTRVAISGAELERRVEDG